LNSHNPAVYELDPFCLFPASVFQPVTACLARRAARNVFIGARSAALSGSPNERFERLGI
jgi:hypothetical protein